MNIFKRQSTESACLVQPVESSGWELVYEYAEQRVPFDSWTPLTAKTIEYTQEEGRLAGVDASWWGSNVIVMGAQARLTLGMFLNPYVRFLPLACAAQKLVLVVPTSRIPALDESRSKIERFSDGRIMNLWLVSMCL
jgi:hypothetical protein